MIEENTGNSYKKILKVSRSFILGFCGCGCGIEIAIRYHRYLKRFVSGHNGRGEFNTRWKGGVLYRSGYKFIRLPDHPFCDNHGYVREHRWIMEQHIGRYLTEKEVVHHRDKNRLNNEISNLELISDNIKHLVEKHLKKDMSDRFCLECNSKETYFDKRGWYSWFKFGGGFICMKCKLKKRHLPK